MTHAEQNSVGGKSNWMWNNKIGEVLEQVI